MPEKKPSLKLVPLRKSEGSSQRFKVLETHNTITPLSGGSLDEAEVNRYISEGWDVRVVAPKR